MKPMNGRSPGAGRRSDRKSTARRREGHLEADKEAKKLTQRIRQASFEEDKTLEGFDFAFNPRIRRSMVTDLATCLFIEKKEHVLVYCHHRW